MGTPDDSPEPDPSRPLPPAASTPAPAINPTPAEYGHAVETALRSAGQRRVNILWEVTQAAIALLVCASTLFVAARLALVDRGEMAAFLLLSNAFFLVIGFYFGRTNHERTGGIGPVR